MRNVPDVGPGRVRQSDRWVPKLTMPSTRSVRSGMRTHEGRRVKRDRPFESNARSVRSARGGSLASATQAATAEGAPPRQVDFTAKTDFERGGAGLSSRIEGRAFGQYRVTRRRGEDPATPVGRGISDRTSEYHE